MSLIGMRSRFGTKLRRMTYAVSAITSSGRLNVRSSYVPEIREAIRTARTEGAQTVDLTRDGQAVQEGDLGKLTLTLAAGSTITKFA